MKGVKRTYTHGSLRTAGWFLAQKHKPVTEQAIRKFFGKHARVLGCAGCYRIKTRTGGLLVITPNKMRLIYGGDDTYTAMTQLAGEVYDNWKARGSREFMLASIAHGEAWGVHIQPDFTDRWATFKRWCTAIVLFCIACMTIPDPRAVDDTRPFFVILITAFALFFWMKRTARREGQRKSDRWATFKRWCVAIALFWMAWITLPDSRGGVEIRPFFVILVAAFARFFWMKRTARREEQRRIESGGFNYPRQATGATYADDEALRNGGLI